MSQRRGRPPKTTDENFYDIFSDADIADQDAMLRVLAEIHRQTRRSRIGKNAQQNKLSLAESAAAIEEEV